jgi:hypothetical protein
MFSDCSKERLGLGPQTLAGPLHSIIDHINGIGNHSREQYIRTRTPCYGLHPWISPLLWQFDQKMTTAVHLSTNNRKTKVVSSLKKAYPSEGVSTLNAAGKVEFLTPLCSTLQFDKVWEAKIAIFGAFHGLLASRSAYPSVPIQWCWPCDPFVAVALSQLEVKSYKFSIFPLFCSDEDLVCSRRRRQKTRAHLLGHNS